MVDRYAYSGVAFTSAKRVQGLGLDWCKVRAGVLLLHERHCTSRADAPTCAPWHNRHQMRACRRRTRCCCSG